LIETGVAEAGISVIALVTRILTDIKVIAVLQ
jgi:hypothetical protein